MSKNPNLLLIHLDQLRWDCLSVYGNKQIKTPNIDSLSAHSTIYKNHFCCYPVCTPSRYSLLSGLDVQDHKGWDNHCTLKSDIPTWPGILKDKGYRTAAVGKMHFTPTYLDVGFDKMILCEQDGPGRWEDDYHRELQDQNKIDLLDLMDQRSEFREKANKSYWDSFGSSVNNLKAEDASSGWISRKSCELITQWNVHSECLMVGFVKPHHPFDPPAPWDKMYDPEKMEILEGWTETCLEGDLSFNSGYFDNRKLTQKSLKKIQAAYFGCISEIDSYIGDMVSLLKKKCIYDNTVIVVTSDHGDYMGYHHMLLKSNHMYDPLMKIPLIIKSVDQKESIRNSNLNSNDAVASQILLECKIQDDRFSKSLTQNSEYVFAHSDSGDMAMARSLNYKLLWNNNNNSYLFFDLKNDPDEIHDLSENIDLHNIIIKHIDALNEWQGKEFRGRMKAYLNESEKSIEANKRVNPDLRKTRIQYYENAFEREYLTND